jgi:hypothetical protein
VKEFAGMVVSVVRVEWLQVRKKEGMVVKKAGIGNEEFHEVFDRAEGCH